MKIKILIAVLAAMVMAWGFTSSARAQEASGVVYISIFEKYHAAVHDERTILAACAPRLYGQITAALDEFSATGVVPAAIADRIMEMIKDCLAAGWVIPPGTEAALVEMGLIEPSLKACDWVKCICDGNLRNCLESMMCSKLDHQYGLFDSADSCDNTDCGYGDFVLGKYNFCVPDVSDCRCVECTNPDGTCIEGCKCPAPPPTCSCPECTNPDGSCIEFCKCPALCRCPECTNPDGTCMDETCKCPLQQ